MTQNDGNSNKAVDVWNKVSLMVCVLGLLLASQLDGWLRATDVEMATRIGIVTLYDFFISIVVTAVGAIFLYHLLVMCTSADTDANKDAKGKKDADDEPEMSAEFWASFGLVAKALGYAVAMPCLSVAFWALAKTTGGRGADQWNPFAAMLLSYVNGWFVVKLTVWLYRHHKTEA